jgi:hypothetical protein
MRNAPTEHPARIGKGITSSDTGKVSLQSSNLGQAMHIDAHSRLN